MTVETTGETWLTVKRYAEDRLEAARTDLELPGSIEVAQLHRGRIQAFREILALAGPKPSFAQGSGPQGAGY